MAVKFKVIERGQPGVVGGGEKKYYASVSTGGEADLDKLTERIEQVSTVSGADIRAVLYALVKVSGDLISEGNIVRLGDLGSLRVSVSSKGEESAEDVKASSIKSTRVVFSPGKMLKNVLKTITFQKA